MQYLYRLNYPKNWDEHTPVAIALHGMGTDYNDLQPVLDQLAPKEIQLSLQGDQPFQSGYQFFLPISNVVPLRKKKYLPKRSIKYIHLSSNF